MQKQTPSPLQAAFWLTREERKYLFLLLLLLFLGLLARHFYLKNSSVFGSAETASIQMEKSDE